MKNKFLHGDKTIKYHEENYPNTDYYDFLPRFEKATVDWNADELMDIIAKTGVQYIVVTAKHHDGVSLYPSEFGLYHTTRDYIKELENAARKRGIDFGLYYSMMEWTKEYSNGFKKVIPYVENIMIPQMKELIERYKPDILWLDGQGPHNELTWRIRKFLDWLFNESPVKDFVTVNDRLGKENTIVNDPKYKDRIIRNVADRYIPEGKEENWEHVNTISMSWGYARNQKDSDYKTPEEIEQLIDKVLNKGGRFLLNVGLRPDGTLDPREEIVLKELDFRKYL